MRKASCILAPVARTLEMLSTRIARPASRSCCWDSAQPRIAEPSPSARGNPELRASSVALVACWSALTGSRFNIASQAEAERFHVWMRPARPGEDLGQELSGAWLIAGHGAGDCKEHSGRYGGFM